MIPGYLAELERSLRGPARPKRRLLQDAADGLADTLAAYQATGMDQERAWARAVGDFGSVPQVAPAFQAELDVAGARRLAAVNVLVLPLLTVFWNYVWERNPYPTWEVGSAVFLVAVATGVWALGTSLAAAWALVRTSRWCPGGQARMAGGIRRLAGSGVLAVAVTVLLLPAASPVTLQWPPTVVAVVAAGALVLAFGRPGNPAR